MEFVSKILNTIIKFGISQITTNELFTCIMTEFSDNVTKQLCTFIDENKKKFSFTLSRNNIIRQNIPISEADFVIAEIKDLLTQIEFTDDIIASSNYDAKKMYDYLYSSYIKYKKIVEHEGSIKQALFYISAAIIQIIKDSELFEKNILICINHRINHIDSKIDKINKYIMNENIIINNDIQSILKLLERLFDIVSSLQSSKDEATSDHNNIQFFHDKKEFYIKNWYSPLFLHHSADKTISLSQSFITPDIKYTDNFCIATDNQSLENVLEQFVQYNKTSTMLITGDPGIGKSTLVSFLANKYQNDQKMIFLRFRDFTREDLEKSLIYSISKELQCKEQDLEDTTLILDGFDEIKALDIRNKILSSFFNRIKDYDKIKCIITSRPAYIESNYFHKVIHLKVFNLKKIETYYETIAGKKLESKDKIVSNEDVLGIPVILYMAIMSNVDFNKRNTKSELYNKIFSMNGGIFDKFYDGKNEYSSGSHLLRNPENTKKYLEFMQDIAYQMYENNTYSLKRENISMPKLEFEGRSISILEFPIKYLFDGLVNDIEFIHTSIYEYFVSEYIFKKLSDNISTTKNILASILCQLFNKDNLSPEILIFLKYRINSSILNLHGDKIMQTFYLMIKDGMSYHINNRFTNTLKNELIIFINMLEFIHLWEDGNIEFDDSIKIYLQCVAQNVETSIGRINLQKAKLIGIHLNGMNLRGIDFTNTKLISSSLIDTDLRNTYLNNADFTLARLENADLRGAEIKNINLYNANIDGMIIDSKQISDLHIGSQKMNRVKVYSDTTGNTLDYQSFLKSISSKNE